jgi:hypothetical protein
MKAGLILPGTAPFRVIRVFRGALRLHHYGLATRTEIPGYLWRWECVRHGIELTG